MIYATIFQFKNLKYKANELIKKEWQISWVRENTRTKIVIKHEYNWKDQQHITLIVFTV